MSQMPLKIGQKCSEQGPTTDLFHWQNPAGYATEIPVSLLGPGVGSAAAAQSTQPARPPATAHASQLLPPPDCERLPACGVSAPWELSEFHTHSNPRLPPAAAQGAQPPFAMNSHSSFDSSVCNIRIFFSPTPDTASLWQVH